MIYDVELLEMVNDALNGVFARRGLCAADEYLDRLDNATHAALVEMFRNLPPEVGIANSKD